MDYNNCVKIFYTQENILPDFNYADYGIGYDYIDFGERYIRYPIFLIEERYGNAWNLMKKKHLLENEEDYIKRDFCSFVVSNGMADPFRGMVFDELCKYKMVSSGGKYKNNIGLPGGVSNKIEFTKRHKFSLCFENTSHPGYVTEKIVEAFAGQTIPIYWGDPLVTKLFNPKAFINVSEYDSIDDLVRTIQRVDNNNEEYLAMLKEPALCVGMENYWEENQNEFKKFLYAIFDQEKEASIKRNMFFWGNEYHRRYYEMRNLFLKRKYSLKMRVKRKCKAINYQIKIRGSLKDIFSH